MANERVRVGTFTRSLLLELARRHGYGDDAGLDVVEVSVPSSPAQFQSLAEGELDLALTSPDNVLAYRFVTNNPLGRRVPARILGALDRGLGLSLALAPGVGSVDEVRGARVGVDVARSGFAFVAYALLEHHGLAPGAYEVVELGSTPRRARALAQRECAATVLNAGNELWAAGRGCRVVATVDEVGPYLGTVVADLGETSDPPAPAHQRVVALLARVVDETLSGRHDEELTAIARDLLGLDADAASAHVARLHDPAHGLVGDGVVDVASLATLVDLRRRYAPDPDLDAVVGSIDRVVTPGRWR